MRMPCDGKKEEGNTHWLLLHAVVRHYTEHINCNSAIDMIAIDGLCYAACCYAMVSTLRCSFWTLLLCYLITLHHCAIQEEGNESTHNGSVVIIEHMPRSGRDDFKWTNGTKSRVDIGEAGGKARALAR
jgi:hypothetical protein